MALLAAAWFSIQPLTAFDAGGTGPRDISADVVSNGGAYTSLSGTSCTCSALSGCDNNPLTTTVPECSFTITNLATVAQNFAITKSCTCAYVSSIVESPSGEIGIGATEKVILIVGGLGTNPNPSTATFTITGAKANVLDMQKTNYAVTITWSGL